jgi:DNA-binding NtrC family response regulator
LGAALRKPEGRVELRRREPARLAPGADDPSGFVARSVAMRATLALARRVAAVDSSALVTGESGTGKERVARL